MVRIFCLLMLACMVLVAVDQVQVYEGPRSGGGQESTFPPVEHRAGLFRDANQSLYQSIEHLFDEPQVKKSLFYRLVPFFLVLMVVFVISILSIAILVVIIKKLRYSHYRKRKKIWLKYRDVLVGYLTNGKDGEVPYFPGLQRNLPRRILIRQLYELANAIYGKKQLQLQHIYQGNGLHPYLTRKIRTRRWPVKAIYLKYLSVRPFREGAVNKLYKLTQSKNEHVRLYGQLAYMSHHPDQAFSFLENYRYTLTEWDQMNLYETMLHNSIPIPDLYHYLDSSNTSVVVFALRLIRWYYVKANNPEVLLHFINHIHPQVRLEAYKTIVELNIRGVEDVLRYHYLKESTAVKKVMIDYFLKNKRLTRALYQEILEVEPDKGMLFYILESLYNQNFKSQQEVHAIHDETDDESIRGMCQHIFEKAY